MLSDLKNNGSLEDQLKQVLSDNHQLKMQHDNDSEEVLQLKS